MSIMFKSPKMHHLYVLYFMQLRISFVFSYDSCLWMAQAAGIEGSTLPLCNITAFRLRVGESMNSHHSFGLCLMFIASTRPLMFLQALSSPCLMKSCSKSFWQEQNAVTFSAVQKTTVLLYSSAVLGL
jgi:hypothetical protein